MPLLTNCKGRNRFDVVGDNYPQHCNKGFKMIVELKGTICAKRIDLEKETGIPAGSVVTVSITTKPVSLDEKRHLIDMLRGAWSGDFSIPSIFADIERQRDLGFARGKF